MLAQKLPEQDNQPTIIDGPEKSGISVTSVVALSLCPTAVTIPPSRPTFVDLHVSQFGWSAVSPSRPAISQSVGRSGGQGKRAAARSHAQPPLCGEHGEHGEHWTLMAAATGATPDQAGCVRTSASASHNPHSASGSGSGKPIKKRDRNSINCRDPAHHHTARHTHRCAAPSPRSDRGLARSVDSQPPPISTISMTCSQNRAKFATGPPLPRTDSYHADAGWRA